jgi:hypothetical protein
MTIRGDRPLESAFVRAALRSPCIARSDRRDVLRKYQQPAVCWGVRRPITLEMITRGG